MHKAPVKPDLVKQANFNDCLLLLMFMFEESAQINVLFRVKYFSKLVWSEKSCL